MLKTSFFYTLQIILNLPIACRGASEIVFLFGNAGLGGKPSFTAGLLVKIFFSIFDVSDLLAVTFTEDTFRRSTKALEGVFETCVTNMKRML